MLNPVNPHTTGRGMTQPDAKPTHAEILLNLIVTLLAPMFLQAAGGDAGLAQQAALGTINEYRAQNRVALLAVAQIIAFSLAAIGSLCQSMQDGVSPTLALRLRGNANALNRSVERSSRALADPGPAAPVTMTPEDHAQEAAIIASVEAAQQAVAKAAEPRPQAELQPQAKPQPQPPAKPQPAPAKPATATPSEQEKQRRTAWAAAIADVAGEYTASLPFLPPEERKQAAIKVSAMSSSVAALLSADPLPLPGPIRTALGPLIR